MLADPRLAEEEGAAAPPTEDRLTEAQRHLALCAPCREALAATERALNALRDPVNLLEPPAGLWDRIAAEIAETPAAPGPTGASVHQLRPRPTPSRRWVPLAAAAAGVLIGGAAVAGVLGQGSEEEAPAEPPVAAPTVLGDAALEPVAAEDISGQAEMVETEDGLLEITVEVSEAPDPEAGYFEVWLRNEDGSRLQSLGAVTGTESTTFQVPEGLDLSEYPVVDVSHEHFDGDPGHSGTTLAAGPMEPADS
nr:anti-sigma factor [Nesterenkonia sp. Act20]